MQVIKLNLSGFIVLISAKTTWFQQERVCRYGLSTGSGMIVGLASALQQRTKAYMIPAKDAEGVRIAEARPGPLLHCRYILLLHLMLARILLFAQREGQKAQKKVAPKTANWAPI